MDSRTSFFTNDIIHLELHDGFTSGRHSIIEMLKIRTQFMLKELQHD